MAEKPIIIGLYGCYCHPFDSWEEERRFSKQKITKGTKVKTRCLGRVGVALKDSGTNGYLTVKFGELPRDQELAHVANLHVIEEGSIILNLYRDDHCFFRVQEWPEGRKSSNLTCTWGGLVDQFSEGETLDQIKAAGLKAVRKRLQEPHDNQFSNKEALLWLEEAILNSNQLELFTKKIEIMSTYDHGFIHTKKTGETWMAKTAAYKNFPHSVVVKGTGKTKFDAIDNLREKLKK